MKKAKNPPAGRRLLRVEVLVPALVVLATFLVFSGGLRNGFLNWDDRVNFLTTPYDRGLGWANLRWMFRPSSGVTGTYWPLVWLLFALTHAVWGLNPFGYHLTGVLVHVAVAAVLYAVTVRFLEPAGPDKGASAVTRCSAGLAVLLFALHPLRVENVAWVSSQHHALAALFFLTSVWAYLRSYEERRRFWVAAALASYALSLLSGPIGMTLPLVLLILDAYRARRDGGAGPLAPRLLEKLPFFFLAVLVTLATVRLRQDSNTFVSLAQFGVGRRASQALYGFSFYLVKTLAPFRLSPFYPLPDNAGSLAPLFVGSGVLIAALSAAAVAARRRWPAALAVWAFYLVILSPVSGLFQFSRQAASDRYSYLSSMGFVVLTAGGLVLLRKKAGARAWRTAVVVGVLLLAPLSVLTWRQTEIWRDSETLWRYALGLIPDSAVAHNGLGAAFHSEGKTEEAIREFERGLQAGPNDAQIHNNLGLLFAEQGKTAESMREYELALQSEPAYADAHNNLGIALVGQGKIDEAIRQYESALQARPDYAEAHNNLGKALAGQGKMGEAIRQFEAALEAQPDLATAENNLGLVLAGQGRLDEAIRHYERALTISEKPYLPLIHNNLASALAQQGKLDAAILHLRQAVLLKPDFTSARENLAILLARAKPR